jgi:hypothetical protein
MTAAAVPAMAATTVATMSAARGGFGCHTGHADNECRGGNQSETKFA